MKAKILIVVLALHACVLLHSQTQIETSKIWYGTNKTVIGDSGDLLIPYGTEQGFLNQNNRVLQLKGNSTSFGIPIVSFVKNSKFDIWGGTINWTSPYFSGNEKRYAQISGTLTSNNNGQIRFWTFKGGGASLSEMMFDAQGRLGIGVTPSSKLSVYGTGAEGWNSGLELNREGGGKGWVIVDGDGMKLRTPVASDNFYFKNDANTTSVFIGANGRMGIGTENPDQLLTVNGIIHSKEIKIDLEAPFADYVFEKYYNEASTLNPDYSLPSLKYIEDFTRKNNHLPGIPSASQIKANGLDVGHMSNILLEKIEELTLYTIEQEKEIETLQKQKQDLEELKEENTNLKNRLLQIEKLLKLENQPL